MTLPFIDTDGDVRMRARFQELSIEWHCSGRHGVVRDVPASEAGEIQQAIEYYLGNGACHWTATRNGRRSVEFVNMRWRTAPRRVASRPWEWCGKTVLFAEWQEQEDAERDQRMRVRQGERVSFEYKGTTKSGLVMHLTPKRVAVMVEGEGRYNVPASQLKR